MRIASTPVSSCLNTEKSASKSSFALLTGTSNPSQSPAGEIAFAVMPFSASQALTASTLSLLGATSSSTYGTFVSIWSRHMGTRSYLVLRQVLAIVRAGRRADVDESALQLGDVALHESETELERRLRLGGRAEREACRRGFAVLVKLHVARHGLAQGKGDERDEEEAASEHGGRSRTNGGGGGGRRMG